MKIACLLLFLSIARSSLSINITSNGLQRVHSGNVSIFKWTIDEQIVNYTIFNKTTGSMTALRNFSNHKYDNISGQITLTINDVQLWDAGNYSLQMTQAWTTAIDSTACLYVYDEGSLILSSGQEPVTEGDTLEFTCDVTSNSLPAAYRPNVYYSWYIRDSWQSDTNSSATVMDSDGNIPAYIIKNNGSTLVISSFQHDDEDIICEGWEDDGTYIVHVYSVKIGRENSVSTKETEESVIFTTQSTTEDLNSNDPVDKDVLLVVVIPLSIFLLIILLVSLTFHLVRRFRKNRQSDQSLQPPTDHYEGIIKPPANKETPQSQEVSVYDSSIQLEVRGPDPALDWMSIYIDLIKGGLYDEPVALHIHDAQESD